MNLIRTLRFIYKSEHAHFLSVDIRTYKKWKYLIKIFVFLNKNYRCCEIFRKKYKILENFVVVGLKYNGKNVKRRTTGFAKNFLTQNRLPKKCIYCGTQLNQNNATADHIIPISKGGNNSQVNLVVVCFSCNSQRGDLEFSEYLKLKKPGYKNNKPKFI